MIETPWADDRLNRQADGEHLIKVLKERYEARKAAGSGSYILNIDASWGQGKTFFLENLRAQLQQEGHLVAYVNAWKDDHANDPLITLMAAIEAELEPMFPKTKGSKAALNKGKKALGIIAGETAKQVSFHVLKTVTGIAVGSTLDKLKYAGALDGSLELDDEAFGDAAEKVWDKGLESLIGERVVSHRKANEAVAEFRVQTAKAIAAVVDNGMLAPMFVFVDELDRCRPLYAIKLLEDLKHLFDIDGLVFVVATDSDQLAHSVKAIYGAEFEARKYLRRFFDRVFVFPDASRRGFLTTAFLSFGIDLDSTFFNSGGVTPIAIIENWADSLALSNRDIVQITEIISSFVTSFNHNSKIEPNFLLAIATTFYSADDVLFQQIIGHAVPEKHSLMNWRFLQSVVDGDSGRKITSELTSQSGLNQISRTLAQSLDYLLQPQSHNFMTPYFKSEDKSLIRTRDSNEVKYPKSVLIEYPSRVRNAGRVIDR